ncbi:MAG: tRNA (N6-threonylcarbamoyladenosine(37)-N6)-methyltransferase TrmO [Deltaproteobacteria bacterium]|nr:tRNA (N6-threonylcarbamoyladenosine(37)-N6)-methyltransferase TrmO [Deltaproteobacteria bacterium]
MRIEYQQIGVIHSPFNEPEGTPIQSTGAVGVLGTVEIFPEFAQGLQDLDGFSHIILLYHFHRSEGFTLLVTPFMDSVQRGVFATRAPKRPNPIGLSVVRLNKVQNQTLFIEGVDILDETPLLDVKPYVSEFDHYSADRIGWLGQSNRDVKETRADRRFE